jgi:hypothetical protein
METNTYLTIGESINQLYGFPGFPDEATAGYPFSLSLSVVNIPYGGRTPSI